MGCAYIASDKEQYSTVQEARVESMATTYNIHYEHELPGREHEKPRMCHTRERHSPSTTREFLLQRAHKNKNMERRPATRFVSEEALWAAREKFAAINKEKMDQHVREGKTEFDGFVNMGSSVGEGILWEESLSNFQAVDIHGICHVTFSFFYDDGKWYERTAYPDATRGFER